MGIKIRKMDMPQTCSDCWFRTPLETVSLGDGETFKYICNCHLKPESVEDGWESLRWTQSHRHKWCPLECFDDNAEGE